MTKKAMFVLIVFGCALLMPSMLNVNYPVNDRRREADALVRVWKERAVHDLSLGSTSDRVRDWLREQGFQATSWQYRRGEAVGPAIMGKKLIAPAGFSGKENWVRLTFLFGPDEGLTEIVGAIMRIEPGSP